jgi:hypothetical protein
MLCYVFQGSTDLKKHVNRKQNVEIDSAASTRGQRKKLSWPPLEAALSILKISFFLVEIQFFDRELIKRKETAVTPNHKISENVLS